MRDISQAFLGMLAAILSSVLVFGGLVISLAEGGLQAASAPQQSPTFTQPVATQKPGEPTYTPSPTPLPTSTPTLVISNVCQYPDEWSEVVVDFGDDIASLASRYNLSVAELRESNCLDMRALMPGMTIYVPPLPPTATTVPSDTPTIPPIQPRPTKPVICTKPYGWVIYIVRRGDTLYSIGTAHGITVQELMRRNCLQTTTIRVGQRLYVPYVLIFPPTNSPVPYSTPTYTPPVYTSTVVPPTAVLPTVAPRTATPVLYTSTPILPSSTFVVPPTNTALPPTLVPTSEPLPTATPPVSPTPQPLPSATEASEPLPSETSPPLISVTTEAPFVTPTPKW